jgi:uncharacterized circularly permuted ATP-grasp superfamily protein/uncharacterized alpha-E superfamily protein
MHEVAATPVSPAHRSLPGYPGPPADGFDEAFVAPGVPRATYGLVVRSLTDLGEAELEVRADDIRRILREHGVTCARANGRRSEDQPWELDLLPLVLSAAEWTGIEAGLTQRAALLNEVLRDLYGRQRLIRDGILPAPLVQANPAYLRACQAVPVPLDQPLQAYAADLGRSPDGRWWVLADLTQTPGGLGFALENRSVLSRVLPEALAAAQPRPISPTLRTRRAALERLAPQPDRPPAIALLTPGPQDEAYFEHAYLARLQGYTLVEGGDLTVRGRRVWLKTLEGLRGVDVILRRVGDALCDPLELAPDSVLGVPGLVEAARAGQVAVANALGTGLVEGPAFLAFLPTLCRHVFGEELRLPSVATWWCGQGRECRYVLEHRHELVLSPAFVPAGGVGTGPDAHVAHGRAVEQLEAAPHEWVGQEQVCLSQLPVRTSAGWASRPIVLRVFVVFDGQQYRVMPGGLARVVEAPRLSTVRLPLAVCTKDVWVQPEPGAAEPPLLLAPSRAAQPPASSDLPSRTADALFWLGRYAERLEQLVRLLRSLVHQLAGDPGGAGRRRLDALARFLWQLRVLPDTPGAGGSAEWLGREVLQVLYQRERPAGVRELLDRIHRTAFVARDRLSADTWRLLNGLEADARPGAGHLPLVRAGAVLNRLVLDLAALSGMENENMTRGHGWRFLSLGRRTERGLAVARLLERLLRAGEPIELLLEPLLEIADSTLTYRQQYAFEPALEGVLQLLLREPGNPRSLAFQLGAIEAHSLLLPAGASPEGLRHVQEKAVALQQQIPPLRPVDPAESPAAGAADAELPDRLAALAVALGEFSDLLTRLFFSHVAPRTD